MTWGQEDFGALEAGELLRTISLSSTLFMLGGLALVFSLLMGFIALPTRSPRDAREAPRGSRSRWLCPFRARSGHAATASRSDRAGCGVRRRGQPGTGRDPERLRDTTTGSSGVGRCRWSTDSGWVPYEPADPGQGTDVLRLPRPQPPGRNLGAPHHGASPPPCVAGWWTREAERLGLPRWWGVATFAAILFHPALVPTRVIRDDIYAPLALLALAGALRACSSAGGRSRRHTRRSSPAGGSASGSCGSTREEGVWVVPGPRVARLSSPPSRSVAHAADLLRLGGRALLYVVYGGCPSSAAFMTANAVVYDRGGRRPTSPTAPSPTPMTALTSIETGPVVPRVPVTEEMRRAGLRGAVRPMAELQAFAGGAGEQVAGHRLPRRMRRLQRRLVDVGAAGRGRRGRPLPRRPDSSHLLRAPHRRGPGRLRHRWPDVPQQQHPLHAAPHRLPVARAARARRRRRRALGAMRRTGRCCATDGSARPAPVARRRAAPSSTIPPSTLSPTEDRLVRRRAGSTTPRAGWLDLQCPADEPSTMK